MTKKFKKEITNHYEKIDPIFDSISTYSPMRLLPKEDGFRPIVNMNKVMIKKRKRFSSLSPYYSKNKVVGNLFEVLKFLKVSLFFNLFIHCFFIFI